MASISMVQRVSPDSRNSCHGFRESREPKGSCVADLNSVLKLGNVFHCVIVQAAGAHSTLTAQGMTSPLKQMGKKCPDHHIAINCAVPLPAVGWEVRGDGAELKPWGLRSLNRKQNVARECG